MNPSRCVSCCSLAKSSHLILHVSVLWHCWSQSMVVRIKGASVPAASFLWSQGQSAGDLPTCRCHAIKSVATAASLRTASGNVYQGRDRVDSHPSTIPEKTEDLAQAHGHDYEPLPAAAVLLPWSQSLLFRDEAAEGGSVWPSCSAELAGHFTHSIPTCVGRRLH